MQRENDPEKVNLLKEKQDRKKRQYSGSRTKTEQRTQRPQDSSSSEHHKRNVQYKENVNNHKNKEYAQYRTQSIPFQDEKKESYLFWGNETDKKKQEDTSSCVSCALKKIVSSEYTCVACLGVLFLLTVLVAFCMVFKTVPTISTSDKVLSKKPSNGPTGSGVQKKAAILTGGRYDDSRLGIGLDDRQAWDRHFSGLAGLAGNGYAGDSYRDLTEEIGLKSDNQLSSILDINKINAGSEKLRDFYKKLVKTEEEIRNLKINNNNDISSTYLENDKFNFLTDRRKRSFRLNHSRVLRSADKMLRSSTEARFNGSNFNLYFPPLVNSSAAIPKVKRFANGTDEPTGYVIEKKQIVVQYKPNNNVRKVPKCSHVPKESKSHEKQMKHPFYKNTQRLDELLDQLLDKNLPELMADPFEVDTLFKDNKEKLGERLNNPLEMQMTKMKGDRDEVNKERLEPIKTDGELDRDLDNFITPTKKKSKVTTPTSPYYDVLLSVSTIVNPALKKDEKKSASLNNLQSAVHLRKLLQTKEDYEEGLGYEDLNEVLADEIETRDEKEEGKERRKRMEEYPMSLPTTHPYPAHPSLGLHNQNWKGPMPLYPDELISMIKQAAIQNLHALHLNKIKVPESKETAEVLEDSDLNDMEYIENYADHKNERLAKMAQAYSDYGVLTDKKASLRKEIEKNREGTMKPKPIKKSISKKKSWKHKFFDRFKKGTSEGFRFEIKPSEVSTIEPNLDILKSLSNHVKFVNNDAKLTKPLAGVTSSLLPVSPDFALFSTVHGKGSFESETKTLSKNNGEDESSLSVHYNKVKSRTLLSTDETKDVENKDLIRQQNKANETKEKENESNTSDFLKAVLDINIDNIKKSKQSHSTNLSDFFMTVSNWFTELAALGVDSKTIKNNSSVMQFVPTRLVRSEETFDKNKPTDNLYPSYNSNMIENIGHRSRVLMSIDDLKQNTASYDTTGLKNENDRISYQQDVNNVLKLTTVIISTIVDTTTQSLPSIDDFVITTSIGSKPTVADNKTFAKRNANADSNLIFWNDIYDDEYGVNLDPVDNTMKAKQPNTRGLDLVKKSSNWIHEKVMNIANNIRGEKGTIKSSTRKRSMHSPQHCGSGGYPKYKQKRFRKRSVNEEEETKDEFNSFEKLTQKMKKVCKEAAKAVQQTKNVKVRQNDKDDELSTSLMQQLIHLMSDVIDFQVQQKTCLRLPPDLQDFLDWLTSADSENMETRSYRMDTHDEDIALPSYPPSSSEREDIHADTRSDCLGTIRAVEDLMQQYEEMSEDDKSKMTGVKEYLENQLQYLHKQFANYDDYKSPYLYQDKYNPLRYKRYASDNHKRNIHNKYRNSSNIKQKRRRKRKFLKNFGRKHTKSTVSIYDGLPTEMPFKNKENLKGNEVDKDCIDKSRSKETEKRVYPEKRNLKDVYYKALADAKKFTTPKNVHLKEELAGFDNAKVVRIKK
ncbi:unnamed protein product [Chilo suppressalis]|uniref:Uncharacterized protein n=1 Tax=Chilo suppressalis TaxID=168631 RepID=A0ABN8EFR0_CHISP|nr:unnamed protein product [Chilo suppressalis]